MFFIIQFLILITSYITTNPDPTKFIINFFKENSKLYYVNAMNDDNGDLYFEFWGESDNRRYLIGKYSDSEESIKFKGNEIFSIDSQINSNYHESIIVKSNEGNINIFSFDYQYSTYINILEESASSIETKNLVVSEYKSNGDFSHLNSIIKLSNNKYVFSIIIHSSDFFSLYPYHSNIILFNFTQNNINGFNIINIS